MKRGRAESILEEVRTAVTRWPEFAEQARVSEDARIAIGRAHRLEVPSGRARPTALDKGGPELA
jgi:serine/threonine-protein kinase HipA